MRIDKDMQYVIAGLNHIVPNSGFDLLVEGLRTSVKDSLTTSIDSARKFIDY